MSDYKVGTQEEWVVARTELLKREKEFTRMADQLARLRRELPWVPVEKEYQFETEDGRKSLADLFDGRSQLAVYHFMFGPHYEGGCPSCSATADSFNGVLAHLEACDVTMVCISDAPVEKLLAYREEMGWSFDWASSYKSDFNSDLGVSGHERTAQSPSAPPFRANELELLELLGEQPAVRDALPLVALQNAKATGTSVDGYFSVGHGFSTFARESGTVYQCYSTYARGTEFLMGFYAILDHAPRGRGEGDQPMSWVRRHHEYGK